MQIQAGAYKGRKLQGSATGAVRPCSGRVKKSLFDILTVRMDFSGVAVLDLFAGFGTLGFEALSRGAANVCFVDSGTKAIRALGASAEDLGVSSRTRIVRRDAAQFVRSETGCYDLVFCDPPYNWRDYENLVREIAGKGLLSREGVLLVEHDRRYNFERHELYAFHKDYGNTRVTFFAHRDSGEET